MATRAERFKSELAQKAHGKKAPKVRKRRDTDVDTSLPGVSASDRRAGMSHTAVRNASGRGARNATVAMEDSIGRPSRKSSRGSANRAKAASTLEQRQISRLAAPSRRAKAGKAAKKR